MWWRGLLGVHTHCTPPLPIQTSLLPALLIKLLLLIFLFKDPTDSLTYIWPGCKNIWMAVEMTFTWQMPGLGYPACANQHSTGMVCHNNIEWIIKVWVLLRCGSALLRWRNQFLHIKAEKSFFRLQCKQFTANLISGSEAHMHRSDHPVNLFTDAYVVSCIVWDFYIHSMWRK